ncbi:GNAT family N-acetyltransferase [Leptolyngbya ohadii]|uniref:GNAT family N-acetyltransferase n=1 Tax=Leptolyngbya ohadii TaxID=1962290 RepID=UPI000B59AEFC|nr:GNAT family N-acetyltransferase [Leptolyngbya ohadii]
MRTAPLFTYLADHPAFIPTIAQWLHQEWHDFYPSETEAQIAAELETHLNRDRIPLTIVALEQNSSHLVGTISLMHGKTEAPPEYAELFPWLASLYVIPEKRGTGLGRLLVQRILQEANRLKQSQVYLWTEIPTRVQTSKETEARTTALIDWYTQQGWQAIAQTNFQQQPVQIMRYDLKAFQDIF